MLTPDDREEKCEKEKIQILVPHINFLESNIAAFHRTIRTTYTEASPGCAAFSQASG